MKRYAFLYLFSDLDDPVTGAWEHSYSSEYVLREAPLTPEFAQYVSHVAAHEFFHIVTPLNIHSEMIEHFNFAHPAGSEHLWLYEGVTEWAANLMQLRGGLLSLDQYLTTLHEEELNDRTRYDTTYTLSRLGLQAFTDEGQRQYPTIYQRGALTATLLDLRLLELSHNTRGLREVILQLANQYGPDRPIREQHFFEDFTALTYPEIADFFRRYVQGAEPLPFKEYFGRLGIQYSPIRHTGHQLATLGPVALGRREDRTLYFKQVSPLLRAAGLAAGDDLLALDGAALPRFDPAGLAARPPGSVVTLRIRRAGGPPQNVPVTLGSTEEIQRYLFIADPRRHARPTQRPRRVAAQPGMSSAEAPPD